MIIVQTPLRVSLFGGGTDFPGFYRAEGGCVLTTAIDKIRRIDTAYEIYLGLYQAITGPEERQKLFREFSPGFFDLIVID